MVNEDELATAFIAKFAASDLNAIDQYTTQTSSIGPANRLNPLSFIPSVQQTQRAQADMNAANQQAIIDQLNREAAMAYPLPPPVASIPQPSLVEEHVNVSHGKSVINEDVVNVLEKLSTNLVDINETLKSIVTIIQKT